MTNQDKEALKNILNLKINQFLENETFQLPSGDSFKLKNVKIDLDVSVIDGTKIFVVPSNI